MCMFILKGCNAVLLRPKGRNVRLPTSAEAEQYADCKNRICLPGSLLSQSVGQQHVIEDCNLTIISGHHEDICVGAPAVGATLLE